MGLSGAVGERDRWGRTVPTARPRRRAKADGTGGYLAGLAVRDHMRVAVVAEETIHHDATDAAQRLEGTARRLAGRGHDVVVFCDRWWADDRMEYVDDGLRYRAVADGDPHWRFAAQLPARLRLFGPDVIHAGHQTPHAVYGAKLASVLTRTPLLVDWYDQRPLEGWRERLRRGAATMPDAVVVPSRLVRTGVRELGRPAEAIDVVPNPIDLEAIRAAEPEPVAEIVYARRLDADANVESLLLALAELRDVGWEAAIVGDGPARADYEDQAADLRIDDRVTFLGDVEEDRRVAIYKGARAFVHTARYTPFATELLRAMACGCVGIAEYHADSSAHELLEHRDRGFRVTSEREMTDAIRSAADLPNAGVDDDFADYDERAILERYLARYRSLQSAYGLL